MQITSGTTVAEVAVEIPVSMEVFERYGIDFCCGGQQPLTRLLAEKGLSVGDLMAEIERAQEAQADEDELHVDWARASLSDLLDHVVATHHAFLREQLPRAGDELTRVIAAHGERHPELHELGRVYGSLRQELEAHLTKEEQDLFPAIRVVEVQRREGGNGRDDAEVATLRAGLPELEQEHDQVGQALHGMHGLTGGFATPADACPTYSSLYRRLLLLETDIHRHVHLENNILIPAVRQLTAA